MPWTGHFVNVEKEERVKFLYEYLRLWKVCDGNKSEQAYYDGLKYFIGGMCLTPEYRYVSKGAKEVLKNKYNLSAPEPGKKYKELKNEHVLPCKVLSDFLMKKVKNDDNWITEKNLRKFMGTIMGIALITQEEDKLLNKAHVRSSLSADKSVCFEDILSDKEDVTVRYKLAGIEV